MNLWACFAVLLIVAGIAPAPIMAYQPTFKTHPRKTRPPRPPNWKPGQHL